LPEEWWLRIKPKNEQDKFPAGHWLSVLVPLQIQHAITLGVNKQCDLIGPGLLDMKLVFPDEENAAWDYSQAVEYCIHELQEFRARGGEDSIKAINDFVIQKVEHLKGAELGQPKVAPNGLVAQQVLVPEDTWRGILLGSETNLEDFQILKELGVHWIATGQLDFQPAEIREWFGQVVMGRKKPPGRRPEAWAKWRRNHLIYAIVRNLEKHSVHPMRNPLNDESGCDAVACAAVRIRLRGISSYETVRKIYSEIKSANRR